MKTEPKIHPKIFPKVFGRGLLPSVLAAVVAAVSEPLITEDESFYLIYEDSDQIVTEGD